MVTILGRSRPIRLLLVVGVVLSLLLPGPASANSFGYPGNYAANNGVHEVYFSIYLDWDLNSSTRHSIDYAYDPHPDIEAYRTTAYRSANDVRVYDANYGATGWYAAAPCPSGATIGGSGQGTWCKARLVQYNKGYYPTAFDTESERRHFACHELGHTLGLFHRSGCCMDTSGVDYYVGSHNNGHLEFYG